MRLLAECRLLYKFLCTLVRDGVVNMHEEIENLVYEGLQKTKNIMLLISQAGWE